MKILISSHAFLPSVGGLENVSAMLADGFVGTGHEVRLVTQTVGTEEPCLPYQVIRRPAPPTLLKLVRWCDIYFHNNFSARTAWPLLFVRKPWVVAHQTWIPRTGAGGWAGRLKHRILTHSTNVSISAAIAADLPTPSIVIGNPYDNLTFHELTDVPRDRDLVFCGRLVADKGADILLKALGILRDRGLYPNLSIIGAGPEEPKLRSMAQALALEGQVIFEGKRNGHELAQLLNAHRIVVVPSRWREPFGVVALEGIASGCVVVGSEGGGLEEAIGLCGITFPSGDAEALGARLEALLSSPKLRVDYRANAAAHLSAYTRPAVTEKYLHIFAAAIHRYPWLVSVEGVSGAEVGYGLRN